MSDASGLVDAPGAQSNLAELGERLRRSAEYIFIPVLALLISAFLFSIFL